MCVANFRINSLFFFGMWNTQKMKHKLCITTRFISSTTMAEREKKKKRKKTEHLVSECIFHMIFMKCAGSTCWSFVNFTRGTPQTDFFIFFLFSILKKKNTLELFTTVCVVYNVYRELFWVKTSTKTDEKKETKHATRVKSINRFRTFIMNIIILKKKIKKQKLQSISGHDVFFFHYIYYYIKNERQ